MLKLKKIIITCLFLHFGLINQNFIIAFNNTESSYSKDFIDIIELVYGEGFLSMGGNKSIDLMFKDINLIGKKVLDIGFGVGGVDFYLAQKYKVDIIGVDVETLMIKEAKNRLKEVEKTLKGSVNFVLEDTSDYLKQFKDETFDIIFSRETILHIPIKDKVKYFEQVHRVFKKNGKIIILDWMHSSPNYSKELKKMIESDGLAYNLVTPKEYIDTLNSAKFKNINFTNTTEQTIKSNEEDCKKIVELKDTILNKFDHETYEESLTSWTSQLNAFRNKELITGIFIASK